VRATTALKGLSDNVFRHKLLVDDVAGPRALGLEPPNGVSCYESADDE
jgi:hypothetical protein